MSDNMMTVKITRREMMHLPIETRQRIMAEQVDAFLDKDLVGHCEGCDIPIFEGDKYLQWLDGPVTCEECSPSEQEKRDLERAESDENGVA